jgi:PEP-CTERM motif
MKNLKLISIAALATAAFATPASAVVVTLDFEGLANGAAIGNYYNGGGGGSLGVTFSPNTLAVIDSDAGGTGNFANEPSASTVMFFLTGTSAILNYAAGFTTGFSFWYSANSAASVRVYDGLNGTGTLLGTINLVSQFNNNCAGDPTGAYCNWSNVGVTFGGTAKSIDFAGTANFVAYDNITFGSNVATGGVPEASTWAMMLVGFGTIGSALRARRRRLAVSFG